MSMAPRLWRLLDRFLAPWGELGRDVLLERSLLVDLPEVQPRVEVTLRQALPADLDEIIRLYSADPWLYLGEGPPIRRAVLQRALSDVVEGPEGTSAAAAAIGGKTWGPATTRMATSCRFFAAGWLRRRIVFAGSQRRRAAK